jgi:uncharacterized lipoprotein YajG
MICSDSLQCYYRRSAQRAWDQCLKLLRVSLIGSERPRNRVKKESLLERCSSEKPTSSFKNLFSAELMKRQSTHVLLVGLLLLSGCSTLPQSQYSAQSTQASNSSRLSHPLTSRSSIYSGDLLNSQSIKERQSQLRQDTSPLPASQSSEQSLDFILHQQVENKQKQINIKEGEIMITLTAVLIVGFIVGVLVGRNNVKTVEKAVDEALGLYEKAQEEIGELKSKIKKPKKAVKKAVKKTAPKI